MPIPLVWSLRTSESLSDNVTGRSLVEQNGACVMMYHCLGANIEAILLSDGMRG